MVPATVRAAAIAASVLSTSQLEEYGNVILNGYAITGPNTTGKLAWQYSQNGGPNITLPNVVNTRPALKGWTTNYQEYFTQLPPNAYGQVPGNPTGFEYTVHSFTAANAPRWAQAPVRFNQNQVLPTVPPLNNPAVIQYSFIHPVADSVNAPPIDYV